MARSKVSEPRILVVEDDPHWRRELSMMYCRVLRGTSLVKNGLIAACRECRRFDDCFPSAGRGKVEGELIDNLHENVVPVAGGEEAIRQLRSQHNHFHVLSLDLNLASQHAGSNRVGATGLDVFDEAVKSQSTISIIAVTGAARDAELPTMLTAKQSDRIVTLESEMRDKLDGAYLFFNKMDESSYGDAGDQARRIERTLNKKTLLDLMRLREEVQQREEPLTLCLFFCIPENCFDDRAFARSEKCVAFTRSNYWQLNRIGLWESELADEADFDVYATEMLRPLSNFPLVVQTVSDKSGSAKSGFKKRGKRRLEPRQQEVLIALATRNFDVGENESRATFAETADMKMRKNASVLRAYLQNELGFQSDPIVARDSRYWLDVPVLLFVCSETHLGLKFM